MRLLASAAHCTVTLHYHYAADKGPSKQAEAPNVLRCFPPRCIRNVALSERPDAKRKSHARCTTASGRNEPERCPTPKQQTPTPSAVSINDAPDVCNVALNMQWVSWRNNPETKCVQSFIAGVQNTGNTVHHGVADGTQTEAKHNDTTPSMKD